MTPPLLLLIPGLLNDARVWAPVRALLGDAAEVLVADVATGDTIADIAAFAWALLHDVPATQRLVIAGFSMGGYIAQQMLATAPRRVDSLALVSTSARPESAEGMLVREKTIAAMERDFAKVVEGILAFGTHENFRADPAAVDGLRTMMLTIGAETGRRQTRAIMRRADQRDNARRLTLPTLVMVGDSDRITPPELADELAALMPHARHERLPDCGHMAPLEQPQRVADALLSLLNLPPPKEATP